MIPQISSLQNVPAPAPIRPAAETGRPDVFQQMVTAAIGRVEGARGDASRTVEQFLSGEGGELHSAAMALQKAELSLELFLQVRNKVVQAYQEIMRMQI